MAVTISRGTSIDAGQLAGATRQGWRPSGAIAENFLRGLALSSSTLASGRLDLAGGMVLPRGVTVSNITYVSHTTAVGTPTNQWFCLVDTAGNVLAKTVNDTTAAWSASTAKTLALASPYTPTSDIAVYCGIVVTATTMPTIIAYGSPSAGVGVVLPKTSCQSTTGLTTPASLGATATLGFAPHPLMYCNVS
jgi:hypothetical protein